MIRHPIIVSTLEANVERYYVREIISLMLLLPYFLLSVLRLRNQVLSSHGFNRKYVKYVAFAYDMRL